MQCTEHTACVVYHYWGDNSCSPLSLEQPIVISIASWRAFCPYIPIYVLDFSKGRIKWSNLPELLSFTPIASNFSFKKPLFKRHIYWRMCSRIFDIDNCEQINKHNYIISCDADIFLLKDPLPLGADNNLNKFCCRPDNIGYFYFCRTGAQAQIFIKYWQASIIRAVYDYSFREQVWQRCGYNKNEINHLHDELVFGAIRTPELVAEIPESENRRLKPGMTADQLLTTCSMHLMQKFWPKKRGVLAWYIKEWRDILSRVLPEELLSKLFSEELKAAPIGLADLADRTVYDSLHKLICFP